VQLVVQAREEIAIGEEVCALLAPGELGGRPGEEVSLHRQFVPLGLALQPLTQLKKRMSGRGRLCFDCQFARLEAAQRLHLREWAIVRAEARFDGV
jgi:hypothetical protein